MTRRAGTRVRAVERAMRVLLLVQVVVEAGPHALEVDRSVFQGNGGPPLASQWRAYAAARWMLGEPL
jgi:hypothetical protein